MSKNRPRRVAIRKADNVCIIVCEGTETEILYFTKFRKRYCGLGIETPKTPKTDPIGLVRFAVRLMRQRELDLKGGAQLWCVFDADHNTDDAMQKAVELAKGKVRIAFSNPSFEFWYLLHFEYYSSKLDQQKLLDRLHKFMPNYTKNMDVFDFLDSKRKKAAERARRLNRMHELNNVSLLSTRSNPSSQAFLLTEEIDRIKAENAETRRSLLHNHD